MYKFSRTNSSVKPQCLTRSKSAHPYSTYVVHIVPLVCTYYMMNGPKTCTNLNVQLVDKVSLVQNLWTNIGNQNLLLRDAQTFEMLNNIQMDTGHVPITTH